MITSKKKRGEVSMKEAYQLLRDLQEYIKLCHDIVEGAWKPGPYKWGTEEELLARLDKFIDTHR